MSKALVIELARGRGSSSDEEEPDGDEGGGVEDVQASAMDDLFDALGIKDGDKKKAASALRDFVKACDYEEGM